MKLTLDCRGLAVLLSQSRDSAQPLAEQARMRWHLLGCQACRNADEQLRFLRDAMQALKAHSSHTAAPAPRLH